MRPSPRRWRATGDPLGLVDLLIDVGIDDQRPLSLELRSVLVTGVALDGISHATRIEPRGLGHDPRHDHGLADPGRTGMIVERVGGVAAVDRLVVATLVAARRQGSTTVAIQQPEQLERTRRLDAALRSPLGERIGRLAFKYTSDGGTIPPFR